MSVTLHVRDLSKTYGHGEQAVQARFGAVHIGDKIRGQLLVYRSRRGVALLRKQSRIAGINKR